MNDYSKLFVDQATRVYSMFRENIDKNEDTIKQLEKDIKTATANADRSIQLRLEKTAFNTEKANLTTKINECLKANEFVSTLQNAMQRKIYVNQETGKDEPGYGDTETKPVKTINYIADTMPCGSQLWVILCSDITLEDSIFFSDQSLILESKDGHQFSIKPSFSIFNNKVYPQAFYVGGNASIYCLNVKFLLPLYSDPTAVRLNNANAIIQGGWTDRPQTQLALVLNNVSIEVESPETNRMSLIGQVTGMTQVYIKGNFSAPSAWVNRDKMFTDHNHDNMQQGVIFTNDLSKIKKIT